MIAVLLLLLLLAVLLLLVVLLLLLAELLLVVLRLLGMLRLLAEPLVRYRGRTGSLIVLGVLILGLMRGALEYCWLLLLLVRIDMLPLLIRVVVILPPRVPLRAHHGMPWAMISYLVGVSGASEGGLNGRTHGVRALHSGVLRTLVRTRIGAHVALLLRHHLIVIGVSLLIALLVILLVVRVHALR